MATKKAKIIKKKTAKKKTVKKKISVEDLLGELMARVDVIGEKLDTLLSKSAGLSRMMSTERDPGFKTQATVAKKFPIPRDRDPRERKMHKVVCAECKQSCEVPFVPRADRPVYCKTCFSNRRNGSSPRPMPNREEVVREIAKTFQIDIPETPKAKAGKAKKAAPKTSKAKPKKTKAKKKQS